MSSRALVFDQAPNPLWVAAGMALRPLHVGLAFPSLVYVAAMLVFLFRPPDLFFFYADRIVFGALLFFVMLRGMALRERIPYVRNISVPMLGLALLAVVRALREPFDAQSWSIIASKYIVPFVLFHMAVLVFRSHEHRKHFAFFMVVALGYLVFIAIAFLADARSLIFPKFILNESIGFHADRARGPFLQAVANGVSLNLLGILILAFQSVRRNLVWGLWLLLPLAVLATMTRAVWISFAVSSVLVGMRMAERRVVAAMALLAVAGLAIGLGIGAANHSLKEALWDRTAERGPVTARLAVYQAGWAMFLERPFTGWTAGNMYAELGRRMEGYRLRIFYVHNTYLALLVEFGLPGLILYGLLFLQLLRLSWRWRPAEDQSLARLRRLWPIVLGVYLFNAFFVDMAYQFVIGLIFTMAGMLCATEERAR